MIICIWMLITLVLFQIWLTLMFKKNNKIIFSLPYLLIVFISPFYMFLDQHIFVKVFGCGCVPITQTNMFNIPFNANDLREVIYSVLIVVCTIIGIILSKRIQNKFFKVLYILLILLFNVSFSLFMNYLGMWA